MQPARTIFLALALAGAVVAGEPHWAFRPLARPAPSTTAHAATAIDRFVAEKLQARGLRFAPEAPREALIRRLSFDLTGLPPNPEEIDAFVADRRPDAYERLVDRLLASPHFGERWGRHWLDAAGYVDVIGVDNDAGTVKLAENKWLYRDYVIRSLNADKPLARFLTEQIAGDEIVDWRSATEYTPEIRDALIATGFLRVAADDTDENELNTLDIRHGVLQRTGETVASNLLALTFQCAKCHDHKYEPLTQVDYYRWLALFQPALNPDRWLQPKQRQFAAIPAAERQAFERHNAGIDKRIAACEALKKRDPAAAKTVDQEIGRLQKSKKSWPHWQVVFDAGEPTPTHILRRGQHDAPGEAVQPGFPTVLCTADSPVPATSNRRLALAKWLTDPASSGGALVLRVQANRVWQHLFGVGIVPSSDNFGIAGQKPTHPELLEWLASAYRDHGGRLKPLIRTIVLSHTYRQSSINAEWKTSAQSADADNRLLWRQRLRRLESESVRDALLATGGNLDRTMFGPPIPVESKPDGSFAVKGNTNRRSVYLLARRNYHPTLLGVFDQPAVATNCTGRTSSAVVLQSLTMLNDSFVLEQSERMTAGVRNGKNIERKIERAFRMALGRGPEKDEMNWSRELLRRHGDEGEGLKHLCHMLLNSSEFLYVK